mmetsp:Transcript_33074/g.40599  ORF Transcript_33074/g.40599 Transcript_33074/m.40599 type:complete len:495 (+) Transcript_33074:83-1567(+)|eukprot:CAMPEP_0172489734 /NCGR_PEP_ID=MMETSP1066-20121228/19935_1 /TAXON_ID=671091 /ORGANISM="Coscinodiscus wailesii, Strain CCMP2513" /LENGTH=494 /DNA_ID=CAMNT_0013257815 /DNA_START=83 /DNA_END=1567 /DNA_ORIENTATION=-
MQFTKSTLLLVTLLCQSSNAFAPITPKNNNNNNNNNNNGGGTIRNVGTVHNMVASPPVDEKTSLIPPLSVTDDDVDVPGLFESSVQKTYGRYPITITSGKGCRLYGPDGETYLDFVAGIATCILGHANPALTEAVTAQMSQLHHVSNLYYIPQQALLAKWLVDNSVADKVFFCNSGAEANEAAIKLARRHASNRGITDPIIITAQNSFHGRTLAALTATAQPKYHKGFTYGNEMVPGFHYTPFNDPTALRDLVTELNTTPPDLEKTSRKRGVAAIMLEPLQGEGGITPGTPDFFRAAREIADETGALLICDEVQVGMGRSGKLWGYENLGVSPDVFTSAKALGGGVPIGAMMARGVAKDVFGPGDHASTYGGNPLACAAGLAVAKALSCDGVMENVVERGAQLEEGLVRLVETYSDVVQGVRGWGLLRGLVLRDDAGFNAGELVGDAMKEGLLLVPAGVTVVRFVPPLIVSEEEVDEALNIIEAVLKKRIEATT